MNSVGVSPKVMHVYVFRLGTAPLDSSKYLNLFLCILYEFEVRIIYLACLYPTFCCLQIGHLVIFSIQMNLIVR